MCFSRVLDKINVILFFGVFSADDQSNDFISITELHTMSETVIFHGDRYEWWQCKTCGAWGVVPEVVMEWQRENAGYHYCHAGHQWGWDKGQRQKQMDDLRRERDRLTQNAAHLEDEIRERDRLIAVARQETERVRKRAHSGVCPCCQRSFANVLRHMKSKHPNVTPITKSA